MTQHIDPCETARVRVLAAALVLQQCTKTACNIVPIPGKGQIIAIGTKADVARLLELAPAAGSATERTPSIADRIQALQAEIGAEPSLQIRCALEDDLIDAYAALTHGATTAAAESIEKARADFENWYVTHVDGAQIGSRDCAARWSAWLAGSTGFYKSPADWKIAPEPWGETAATAADRKAEFLNGLRSTADIVATWPIWKQTMDAPACTCPSGDGSLRWPCPQHSPEATAADQQGERCTTCDGTGDVHRADGEWMGECTCAAGVHTALERLKIAAEKTMRENEELRATLAQQGAAQAQAGDVARGPYTEAKQAAIERGECKARDTMELCSNCGAARTCLATHDSGRAAMAAPATSNGGKA